MTLALKKVVSEVLSEIYPALHGEWTDREYRDLAIATLQRDIEAGDLNLHDHIEEIVGRYIDVDIRHRSKVHFSIERQFVLGDFKHEYAEKQVIAIGDGKRVKVSEASFRHLFQHHINQTREAHSILQAAEETNQVMESELGQLLYEHPSWTIRDGMRHLGYWESF